MHYTAILTLEVSYAVEAAVHLVFEDPKSLVFTKIRRKMSVAQHVAHSSHDVDYHLRTLGFSAVLK